MAQSVLEIVLTEAASPGGSAGQSATPNTQAPTPATTTASPSPAVTGPQATSTSVKRTDSTTYSRVERPERNGDRNLGDIGISLGQRLGLGELTEKIKNALGFMRDTFDLVSNVARSSARAAGIPVVGSVRPAANSQVTSPNVANVPRVPSGQSTPITLPPASSVTPPPVVTTPTPAAAASTTAQAAPTVEAITAGSAAGTAAGAAEGAVTGAAATEGALAGVAAAAGPAAIAVGAFAAAVGIAGLAVKKLADMIASQVSQLSQYSAEISGAQAQSEIRMTNAQMRRANTIGPRLAVAENMRSRAEEAFYELGTQALNAILHLLEPLAPVIERGIATVEIIAASIEMLLAKIDEWIADWTADQNDDRQAAAAMARAQGNMARAMQHLADGLEPDREVEFDPFLEQFLNSAVGLGIPRQQMPRRARPGA